jgi:hypothetical protein
MGLVVFSLFNLFFSIEAKDQRESAFSLSTLADRTFIVTAGVSLFLLVMATVLAPCQAILKTTALDEDQWLLCTAVALSIIVVSEIRKAVLRRTDGRAVSAGTAGAAAGRCGRARAPATPEAAAARGTDATAGRGLAPRPRPARPGRRG